MAYLGNLICQDCGLTFTSQWGSFERADEYRCERDHVVFVEPESGTILSVDGLPADGRTPSHQYFLPIDDAELRRRVGPSEPGLEGRACSRK